MVYAAKVENRELTFQVSGMLWNRSLVMRDLETGSLWSHILGRAMDGPLKGQTLEILPAVISSWKSWKNDYPETTAFIMPRKSLEFETSTLEAPGRYVFGIRIGGVAKAWFFEFLRENPVIHDSLNGVPLLVVHNDKSMSTRIWSRISGQQVLEFKLADSPGHRSLPELISSDGSIWDPNSGRAVAGPLLGNHLTPVQGIISYAQSWKFFFPETLYDNQK